MYRSFGKGPASEFEVEGQDLKSQVSLQGAVMTIYKITQINIIVPDGGKESLCIRASNGNEVDKETVELLFLSLPFSRLFCFTVVSIRN